MKKPWLSALLNITTGWAGYIYNNHQRKLLGWWLCVAWGLSIAERFVYYNPIEKPTPLTFVYPAIAIVTFAIDGFMEARTINKKEKATIVGRVMQAISKDDQ